MGRNVETAASFPSSQDSGFTVRTNGKRFRVENEQALRESLSGSSASFDLTDGGQKLTLDIHRTERGTIDVRTTTPFGRSPNGRTPLLYGRAQFLAFRIPEVLNIPTELTVVTDDRDAILWALSPEIRTAIDWDETVFRNGKLLASKRIDPLR